MSSHRYLAAFVAAGLVCAVVSSTTGVSHADITFTDIAAGLDSVYESSVAWGDYDSDGDLDVLLTGNTGSGYVSSVYRNDDSVFTDIAAGLTPVRVSSVAWGDYDNDGDLDILLTGDTGAGYISKVYRNDAGVFTDIGAGLQDVCRSSVAWGDYDNDGDLDILLTGYTGSVSISRVYRNDAGAFTDIAAGLEAVCRSSVAWGDYDNDGDLDILLTGWLSAVPNRISRVYRNDAGVFTYIPAGLEAVSSSSAAWGDYDNDGDLDILLTGMAASGSISSVYRNNGDSTFTDISAGLPGVYYSSVAWGDYDNDGDLDILLTGETGSGRISEVYRNDGGAFTDIGAGLTGVDDGSVAWGDYDNDGDLDILLTGNTGSGYVSSVYQSDGAPANAPPSAPGDLSASVVAGQVTFSWTASADAQTPSSGLSYNLRVGTTPGGWDIVSPMADAATGYRRVVELGNAQQRTSWTLTVPAVSQTYHWSVQAVDGAWAGSAFAAEESLQVFGFTDIAAGLPEVWEGSVAWGDYDNDGDLDILLTGDTGGGYISKVYRNDAGVFTDIGAGLEGVSLSSVAWGDYDNDGDLDILLTGWSGWAEISRVYRNDGGVFNDIGAGLEAVRYSSVAWGDYDNDGDLDILLTGDPGSSFISSVYRNDAGDFSDIGAGLDGVRFSAVAWGDYDNDGDLDILLTGYTGSAEISRVYRNDGGDFTDIAAGLPGVCWSSVAWGDYDNDGDLDILLTGWTGSVEISRVYRNDGGVFTDIAAGLEQVCKGSVAWGDCDNDGDLDVLLAGEAESDTVSLVYRNDAGAFTDICAGLPGVCWSSAAWGDYDNDGDLDILLTGNTGSGYVSSVYQSDGAPANTPPAAPGDLSASVVGAQVTFSWTASTDAQTPSPGLSYNLRVGTTPGGSQIVSPLSDAATGYRRVVQLGNAQERTSWTVTVPLVADPYYWSVQAVDGAWAGSAFAAEESVEIITFTDIAAGLEAVRYSSVAWGDYDNDGDLDVLLTGYADSGRISRVYRNDAGLFTDIGGALEGVHRSSVAWGDYDNDGDLDILLTGWSDSGRISCVYRNEAGVFTDIGAGLPGVCRSSVAWGDYDNDGDLDILLTGTPDGSTGISRVYRNDDGIFTNIGAGLTGVFESSVAWGDYDNDGDLDILLTGDTSYDPVLRNPVSRVYRNDAGVFTDISAGLEGVYRGSVAWGDYDNDGDLDILLTGDTFLILESAIPVSSVYRNDGGGAFTDIGAGLASVYESSVAWGDYDNDGDLDILLTGSRGGGNPISCVYRSDGAPANTPPAAPGDLSASVVGAQVTFSWTVSTDAQTPSSGLSYNLRVGTTPGGPETVSPMADAAIGYRRVVQLGNAQQRTSWTLTVPVVWQTYYWSVQAVDGAWAGSAFATEESVECMGEEARVDAIADIPDDQGRWVRIFFTRSGYDLEGVPTPVVTYYVWRRIDDEGFRSRIETESVPLVDGAVGSSETDWPDLWAVGADRRLVFLDSGIFLVSPAEGKGEFPPGTWEVTGSAPALQQDSYIAAQPTLGDSTDTGMFWSVFCISAHTDDPTVWYVSTPDSGYSVDNLEPQAPRGLTAEYDGEAIALAWDENLEEDFNYYAVYRGTESGFPLGDPIGYSTTPTYTDDDLPGPDEYWYRITATDFSGNESDPSDEASAATTGVALETAIPTAFYLGSAIPNPFNPITEITYGIPAGATPARVVLSVYDATGREVTTLVDVDQGPGEYRVVWDGRDHKGAEVASGVYFYRLVWNGRSETKRMVLLK